jgi:hypothetical protein
MTGGDAVMVASRPSVSGLPVPKSNSRFSRSTANTARPTK